MREDFPLTAFVFTMPVRTPAWHAERRVCPEDAVAQTGHLYSGLYWSCRVTSGHSTQHLPLNPHSRSRLALCVALIIDGFRAAGLELR